MSAGAFAETQEMVGDIFLQAVPSLVAWIAFESHAPGEAVGTPVKRCAGDRDGFVRTHRVSFASSASSASLAASAGTGPSTQNCGPKSYVTRSHALSSNRATAK